MSTKRSRVYPLYKTKYRVTNGASYNETLVRRGNLRLWISPDAIANWNAKPSKRRRGGQPRSSNLAIETALTLRLVYHLPLRQTEGFVTSIFDLIGLSVFREGQWAAAKHGSRGFQGWKKLHLGVDGTGIIVAQALTGPNVDGVKTGVRVIQGVRVRSPEVRRD